KSLTTTPFTTRNELNIYKSSPDGMSWTLDKGYTGLTPSSGSGQLRMAIGADGTIALAVDRANGIFVQVKRPGGSWPASLQTPGVTTGSAGSGIRFDTISVAVGGEGTVYAMFKRDQSQFKRWVARLKAGSSTWEAREFAYPNTLITHPIGVVADANG